MDPESLELPDDVAALKAIIALRDETIAAQLHTITILSRIAFGKKSEKRPRAALPVDAVGQGHLFHAELLAEAERTARAKQVQGEIILTPAKRSKMRGGRRARFPAHLPRVETRYELEDEITFLDEPCPCGSAHRRIDDVQGRLDDVFRYEETVQVHPHLFRSALGRQRNIVEYQVHQTERGADIAIHCVGAVDTAELQREIAAGLSASGLEQPSVSIRQVKRLERLATGKLKRFVPLPAGGPAGRQTPANGADSA